MRLQDEITRAVAGALKTKLLPGEHAAAQSERPPSGNLEAYNALLQGRFYSPARHGGRFSQGNRALTRRPPSSIRVMRSPGLSYRSAWTGLGGDFLEGAAAQEAYAKAREAADRALALSPGPCGRAHCPG